MVPWRTLNIRHHATAQCARQADWKSRKLAEEDLRESTERAFEAYDAPLEILTAFRYLERVKTEGGENWPTVVGNLQKARKSWGWLLQILSREGADPKVSGHFSRR